MNSREIPKQSLSSGSLKLQDKHKKLNNIQNPENNYYIPEGQWEGWQSMGSLSSDKPKAPAI